MKPTKLTIILLIVFSMFALFTAATVTHLIYFPDNLYETSSTSINFNWTVNTTGSYVYVPAYIYLSDVNNESDIRLNKTFQYCMNASYCNLTVNGLVPGYYQWNLTFGGEATKPTVSNSLSTFNTTDRPARWEGNSSFAAPFNTSWGNNTLNFIYWNNSKFEACNVTLERNNSLAFVNVSASIRSACNFTVLGSSVLGFQSNGVGTDESIYVLGGNATMLFGLIPGTNYTGQANNTFNVSYSVNGTATTCLAYLNKHDYLNVSIAASNISTYCSGLDATNTSSRIVLTGTGYGNLEYITINPSPAMSLLGFQANTTTGMQTNYSTPLRWLQVYEDSQSATHEFFRWVNSSGFVAMTLDQDTGNLNVTGDVTINGALVAGTVTMTTLNVGTITATGNITTSSSIVVRYNTTEAGCITRNDTAMIISNSC